MSVINRRQVVQLIGGALASSVALSHAQQGVTRRIFVGYPPGGIADGLARILAPLMTKTDAPMVVENKAGASGQIAAEWVKNSAPDGLNLLLTPLSMLALLPLLYRKPMYNGVRDFMPLGAICDHSCAIAVNGASPHRTLPEFLAWCKSNPSQANFATTGAGTSPHFLGVFLSREAHVPLNHVPYKGTAPALQDLMGNQVSSSLNPLPTMLEYHRAGKLRILAVTNPKRVASIPEVPTFAELNFGSLTYTEWYGMFASPRTPEPIASRLEDQVRKAVTSNAMAEAAKKFEVQPLDGNAAALKKTLEADSRRWAELVKATGIQLDS